MTIAEYFPSEQKSVVLGITSMKFIEQEPVYFLYIYLWGLFNNLYEGINSC
jgi:hypothetical protein